ncbi:MAG: hypothetical protein HY360_12185 [Verrucomicrobia bacterium]|nr:hypothetical protein [Verrucomicrobiota bacterium]
MKLTSIAGLLAIFTALGVIPSSQAVETKPAVLLCIPDGAAIYSGDLTYLAELHDRGFEIDRAKTEDDFMKLDWERIKRYNVLVIFRTPDAQRAQPLRLPPDPKKVEDFANLMEKYLDAGGGIFLMPQEMHISKQCVSDLTDRWGARLPTERIQETDPAKTAVLTHLLLPAAFTDQALPSPVSDGVKQIWYPLEPAYNAQQSGPIWVDENWQVVVKASKTAKTTPTDLSASPYDGVPHPFSRPGGVKEPPLFAIRGLKQGRVALVAIWPQYSFLSGTKWLFNREVLSAGLKEQRSDFGRLIENTLHWLAAPSLKSGALGGYVMPADELLTPNRKPGVKEQFERTYWDYEPEKLGYGRPPENGKLFRGLIGARSSYSTGKGTIAEYAHAAGAAGLDFVVFLEDYGKMTEKTFAKLKADCKQHSTTNLVLLAGLTMRNNLGDSIFCFGTEPVYPPDKFRTGPKHDEIALADLDDKGNYTGGMPKGLDFIEWTLNTYHGGMLNQLGFYNYSGNPHGFRLATQRASAAAGVRYYKDGKLVEDVTEDYLKSAQTAFSPGPVSINEVASPEDLKREVASGHALTYAQARSLDRLMPDALRWTNGGDGVNVFPSDGPIIHAWPKAKRVMTFGGEEFVTAPAVNPMPLSVTAEKGIKELRIYNGAHLFRRFLCDGAKEFNQTLVLNGTVQRSLVLVAEDMGGGKAVSFASFSRCEGSLAPTYCSDHMNDGARALLVHGTYNLPINRSPLLPAAICGDTWDGGGGLGGIPLVNVNVAAPILESDRGREDGNRFEQDPFLEYSDEGAIAVGRFHNDRVFADNVLQIINAYVTWGPLVGPSRLFAFNRRYREVTTPTIGAPDAGWAAPGIRVGVNASLFTDEITFKQDQTLKSLQPCILAPGLAPALLVIGDSSGICTVIELAHPGTMRQFPVKRGEWFGYYSNRLSNSHLFINRGETILLTDGSPYVYVYADAAGRQVKKNDRYDFEVAGFGFPVNVKINNPADFMRYVAYLKEPTGLTIKKGKRLDAPGLIELTPENHAVEVSVPKPTQRLDLSLPVRVRGLNPRWTAGLFQKTGYVKGDYGAGENRYRELGLDFDGNAFFPLFVDYAPQTHMLAGHPVVAGPEGKDLFIQATKVRDNPDQWHVSVNNPTDAPITTQLSRAMDLPGLKFSNQTVTLKPGEYRFFE